MAMFSTIINARFWSKVDVLPNEFACWEWRGSISKNGYGCFSLHGFKEGAHRVAYMMDSGEIPEPGMVVKHTCDNPRCVNPSHLELGTKKENFQDYVERGNPVFEGLAGSANGMAKLDERQVVEIRRMIATGKNNTAIAKIYGVTHSAISAIRRGKSWRIGPISVPHRKDGNAKSLRSLTEIAVIGNPTPSSRTR